MKYTHAVKAHGKFYPAGAEVPEKTEKPTAAAKQKQTKSTAAKEAKQVKTEEA
ncbi:MAG: hypothetical protein LIO74_10980 [Ruminococcus sp.]|nr:hypothetical protein [Ruminococcus sp.]MCD7958471.1 hypothetical protein [Ruminococcus sp.]